MSFNMLQNPDGTYDETITVYSSNKDRKQADAEAQAKGERVARERSQDGAIAVCLGCIRITKSGRYACTLRIEPKGEQP